MLTEPITDTEISAPGETLQLRLLETAARYLLVNAMTLPVVLIALAGILWFWHPLLPLTIWAGVTVSSWALVCALIYRFLRDERRLARLKQWTAVLAVSLFVGSAMLCSVALLFWVDNDRVNNVLLYVFVASGLACGGAQSAPSRALVFGNLAPYVLVLVSLSLLHEPYPLVLGFVALEFALLCIVLLYARAVRQLATEMLLLREEKRELIDRLESALAAATAARQRAEMASRAKSQFLANMSHELRTPLNAVLGFSEVIRDRLFGEQALARYAEYAGNIHASGSHLLELINDVLDLSKIEAGKLELAPERYDLVTDVPEMLRLVEPQAARKDVRLVLDMPKIFELIADKRALRQILVNLLANAVKFTPPGGKVTLSLRRHAGGDIALSVSDTGVGIRPEDMTRVLESFGQGRHDISPTDEQGTGLGLAISKSLIEAHGGSIAIESVLGEGTTVTVTIPHAAIGLAA